VNLSLLNDNIKPIEKMLKDMKEYMEIVKNLTIYQEKLIKNLQIV